MKIFNPKQSTAEPFISSSKYLSVDLETTGLDFLRCSISMLIVNTDDGNGFLWDTRNNGWPTWFNKYLSSAKYIKIIQNGLFDCSFIQWHTGARVVNVRDTMLQEQIIQGVSIPRSSKSEKLKMRYSSSLKYQLIRYNLPHKEEELIPMPDKTFAVPALSFLTWPNDKPFHPLQIKYGFGDVAHLLDLHIKQTKILKEKNLYRVARLENEVLEAFVQMRINGIGFDDKVWFDISDKYKLAADKELKKLNRLAKINWNSPAQVKDFFKKKKKIKIPTFSQMDKKFKNVDKDLDTFILYRSMYYAQTTFGKKWLRIDDKKKRPPIIGPDGRIHPDFTQIVATGRGSCINPNLQNLPNYAARKTGIDSHRRAFIPSKGCSFVPADFAGQEFALMMFLAKEKTWLDHIRKKHDVHSIMSEKALGKVWMDAAKSDCRFVKELQKCKCPDHQKQRDYTKRTTFGIAYGKGPAATAVDIETDVKFARKLINSVYKNAPRLKKYLVKCGNDGLEDRQCFTPPPFNRYRRLIGFKDKEWHIKNQAINSPIQGAGGDMIKQAMVYLHREIFYNGWAERGAKLILWIHDEVVTEVKTKYAETWSKVVSECMERAAALITNGERLISAEPSIRENLDKD